MMVVAASACSGRSGENIDDNRIPYENPIDSILRNQSEPFRLEEVCRYLKDNPQFVHQSDSVGFHRCFSLDPTVRAEVLWQECGDIRIYSIPSPTMYATQYDNLVQFLDNGKFDSDFLQDDYGDVRGLFSIKSDTGKTFYILKTRVDVEHQGYVAWERISAFSISKGRLVKENLFRAGKRLYDAIELECGGQRDLPISFYCVVLIDVDGFEERPERPWFVVAEVNERDWPTGKGFKYQWNGRQFEYVGKCNYDADGVLHEGF